MKSNAEYLKKLSTEETIICLQEHWLWSFEMDQINKIVPQMECYTRCHDCDDPITNFQIPRSRGGISILWPREWDKYVKKLDDGNNRIIAVEIKTDKQPVCLVNAYMPTKKANSDLDYQENLDIIQSILDKYEETHSVVICGDMNGTLLTDRSNSHDIKLRKFAAKNMLNTYSELGKSPTFYHNDGHSSSQIDYIMSNHDILELTTILVHDPTNVSSHTPVRATLSRKLASAKKSSKQSHTAFKLLWDKVDKREFQLTFRTLLTECQINWDTLDVDQKLHQLNLILQQTADLVVPKRLIKLNGFKRKASPTVRHLIWISKNRHREWDAAGRPRDGHPLFIAKKDAKRALRQQQRKEVAKERQTFLENLENNPDEKTFFQLIRRNQTNIKSSIPESMTNGEKTASTPKEQRELFASYFKELATPQDKPDFDNQLLTSSQKRCQLIQDISEHTSKKKISISKDEIRRAIQKLKSGKAADEYGITAEHIKYSGNEVLMIYQSIFQQIYDQGAVADSFKTGVITPIPKKGKDPTQTENYRGITVTSVHGKIFEYILIEKSNIHHFQQSDLQFGFTEGLSPNMAALVLSEVSSEIAGKEILFITTLDSQKAFDVVDHHILLDKIHAVGMEIEY